MSSYRQRVVPVLIATAALIGAANLGAYATNGQPLVGGRTTTATRPTVVVNKGKGPALQLTSKPSAPSLAVSSKQKVARLNADRVDGLEGASLQNQATHFVVPTSASAEVASASFRLKPGRYLMTYSMLLLEDPFSCYVAAIPNVLLSYVVQTGYPISGATASGIVTVPANGTITLSCSGVGTGSTVRFFTEQSDALSTVDFLRLDRVATGTTLNPASRPPAPGRAAAPGR